MQKQVKVNGKLRTITGWQALSEIDNIEMAGERFVVQGNYEDGCKTTSGHTLTMCEDGYTLYTEQEFAAYLQHLKTSARVDEIAWQKAFGER